MHSQFDPSISPLGVYLLVREKKNQSFPPKDVYENMSPLYAWEPSTTESVHRLLKRQNTAPPHTGTLGSDENITSD